MAAPSDEKSLWDLYLEWQDLPADTPMPTSLDAHRAAKADDGLAHCGKCGGHWFVGTITFASDGRPLQVLPPQRCIGCGHQRPAEWP